MQHGVVFLIICWFQGQNDMNPSVHFMTSSIVNNLRGKETEGDNLTDCPTFVLMAFVNDLKDQDVDEGNDGVEHM